MPWLLSNRPRKGIAYTADIANSYYREVFAVPGRTTDRMSQDATVSFLPIKLFFAKYADFVEQLGWDASSKTVEHKQKELFLNLNEEEEKVFNVLNNTESMHVNLLAIELNIPVTDLFFTLLELEMKNVVKALPGGVYKLA